MSQKCSESTRSRIPVKKKCNSRVGLVTRNPPKNCHTFMPPANVNRYRRDGYIIYVYSVLEEEYVHKKKNKVYWVKKYKINKTAKVS